MRTARNLEAEWKQVLRGSVGMGAKEGGSNTGRVWAGGFRHVTAHSSLARVIKPMNCLFLQFSNYFSNRGKPRITEIADIESADKGAHLYFII
jgi:hypothetical protein